MENASKVIRWAITSSVVAIILISVIAALGISNSRKEATVCTCVNIIIKDSTESQFVSKTDVEKYIASGYGKCKDMKISSIDLTKIESGIDNQSAVLKSEAYITPDGKLNIEVIQRKPFMRLQKGNKGFYCDSNGYIFPTKTGYSSHVTVIDGHIPLSLEEGYKGKGKNAEEMKWISDMTEMVAYMMDDKVWADDIVQVNVRENGDLILIPREGNEKFIFGKPENIKDKFKLMSCYYTHILPAKGKGYYSTVNVKYDGQIICKK